MTANLKVFISYSRKRGYGVYSLDYAVYARLIVKRTNINLDTQLVSQAAALLGTVRVTDTVHAAMREVVAREHRRRLVRSELFGDMSQEDFDAMRSPRTFDE